MNWFYHDPGRGRMGPVSAEDLRTLYRERRIDRDSLVWREGLREWQPLDRLAEELDLYSVTPDASRPPPLPPGIAAPAVTAHAAPPRAGGRPVAPAKKPLSGCLIALIVVLVLAVPGIAILAAIALPAYQEYTVRANANAFIAPRDLALRTGIANARRALGRCPEDTGEAGLSDALATGVRVGTTAEGHCAFEITLAGTHRKVDGRTIVFVATPDGGWDCSGGDLPANYRPAACRARPQD
ncbi:GYF domain-containing protein [Lysobacter humi (ex Lee et al. 2017)]